MEHFGLEALSRGAKSVIFCDNSKKAINIIKRNVEETKLQEKCEIINKDYIATLNSLKGKKFDIIFLDPPYKTDYGIIAIKEIVDLELLSENGIIIFETNDLKKEQEILKNKNIEIYDKRKYGIAFIMFIRKE